jgi:hypothetical protein
MKRILLLGALCGGALAGHCQSLSTWLDELAALRTLQETVGEGYQIMKSGLNTIGEIKQTEYGLHRVYFGSLDSVSTAVQADPKLVELRTDLNRLLDRLNAELNFWRKQEPNDQP